MRRIVLVLCLASAWGCGSSDTARGSADDANVIEGDELRQRDLRRVEDMLRGQVAGVEVYDTPSGLAVRIRGGNAFRDSPPLFVIDGLPLQQGADGVMTGINPGDIESIRVLKNVSDTAEYGSRGANGVIVITTKRPPAVARDSTR